MQETQEISIALKKLAGKIREEIDIGLTKKSFFDQKLLQQDRELVVYEKITKFNYTERGIESSTGTKQLGDKLLWRSALNKIQEKTKILDEYNSIISQYNPIRSDMLDGLTSKIALYYLENNKLEENYIDSIIDIFIKDINNEPILFTATVYLQGIVLKLESLEFSLGEVNFILRKTQSQDLERELPIYSIGFSPSVNNFNQPSAILTIASYETESYEIQLIVEQSITILRLFGIGSVKYISYKMGSEAVVPSRSVGGTIGSLENTRATEIILVTSENSEKLQKFWQTLIKVLPQNLYNFSNQDINHVVIAYRRYSDALLRNNSLEERITDAVIGLEALLLCENMEISFRFTIRGAKILNLLGFSALEVKDYLKFAYNVRSAFVHGDDSKLKDALKDVIKKYSDSSILLLKILDYLRILILVMICVGQNSEFTQEKKGKREFMKQKFLQLVDNSLIDDNKEDELKTILNSALSDVPYKKNLTPQPPSLQGKGEQEAPLSC